MLENRRYVISTNKCNNLRKIYHLKSFSSKLLWQSLLLYAFPCAFTSCISQPTTFHISSALAAIRHYLKHISILTIKVRSSLNSLSRQSLHIHYGVCGSFSKHCSLFLQIQSKRQNPLLSYLLLYLHFSQWNRCSYKLRLLGQNDDLADRFRSCMHSKWIFERMFVSWSIH